MSRLHELVERELVVVNCLASALRAHVLYLHRLYDDPPTLAEPASTWRARAESSLLFAAAELSYLTSPAPPPLVALSIPFRLP